VAMVAGRRGAQGMPADLERPSGRWGRVALTGVVRRCLRRPCEAGCAAREHRSGLGLAARESRGQLRGVG
jgi:hypothetical protein